MYIQWSAIINWCWYFFSMAGMLDVRLIHGLDSCSGHLEVQYLGSWWSVNNNSWSNTNSDTVCAHLGCGKAKKSTVELFVNSKTYMLDQKLKCKEFSIDIKQCQMETGTVKPEDSNRFVNIICAGILILFMLWILAQPTRHKPEPKCFRITYIFSRHYPEYFTVLPY